MLKLTLAVLLLSTTAMADDAKPAQHTLALTLDEIKLVIVMERQGAASAATQGRWDIVAVAEKLENDIGKQVPELQQAPAPKH